MVQIYLLLVLGNIIMGLILSRDFFYKKFESFSSINQILSSEILQVTIGSIGTIVGILALFLRFTGNILIIGDLIPAILAIISGITIFVEYISQEEDKDSSVILFIVKTFVKNKNILGFLGIVFGLIHFLAPSIELL